MKMAIDYTPNKEKTAQADLGIYSIVVADDDRTMAELLATNLRRLGHRVVGIAWNGKEAVELTMKTRPDVVIMDIHMPVLDGFQAAQDILASRLVPIVLSTGMTDARSVNRAVDLNVISYLVKPFSPAQLKVALHMAVAQCRAIENPEPVAAA